MRKITKSLSLVLALLMLIGIFTVAPAFAATKTYVSGKYKYTLHSDGTAEIVRYTGSAETVNIPSKLNGHTITAITYTKRYVNGEPDYLGAFDGKTTLKKVTIPSTVKTLGHSAFEDCTKLVDVTIPNSVTKIGCDAFHRCTGLKTVIMPNSVKSIGCYAYMGCKNITTLSISTSAVEIDPLAFAYCSSIVSVTVPKSVKTIGERVFSECTKLANVYIQGNPTSIGYWMVENTPFYKNADNWSGSVLYCGNALIEAKEALSGSYAIRSGTTVLADEAFSGCKITNVTIPDSAKNIGTSAFDSCKSLKSIKFPSGVTVIKGNTCQNCSSMTSVSIPSSVTKIEYGAFSGCSSMTSVSIPSSVTKIEMDAFSFCTNLTSVTVPSSVKTLEEYAFGHCSKLATIKLPSGLTSIGYNVFYNTAYYKKAANWKNNVLYIGNYLINGKTSISGSYSVKSGTTLIAQYAFWDCEKLKSVTIPVSVKHINFSAFYGCKKITDVYYAGTVAQWKAIKISTNYYLTHATIHYKGSTPKLTKTSVTLKAGNVVTIPISNKGTNIVTCSTSNKKVAVGKNGKVSALSKGTAKITVKVGTKKFTYNVKVTTSPKLSKSSVTVKKGGTVSVKITGKASTVNNVYTNTSIAKVISKNTDTTIKVQGLKKGTTTLKIKVNGVVLKLNVKVN